jgi:hypothetical protein
MRFLSSANSQISLQVAQVSSLPVSCFAIARSASLAAIRGGGRTHGIRRAAVLMLLKDVSLKPSLQANQLKKHTHGSTIADPEL